VWDKGRAAMVDVEVASDQFTATYSIFLPGRGGFGGERGPSAAPPAAAVTAAAAARFDTSPEQAALYRLTGDRHPIHIDPGVAGANGFERPILHGLCTLGIVAREVAATVDAHPADLVAPEARLAAPVLPGDAIEVAVAGGADDTAFEARVGETVVLAAGRATFAPGRG